MRELTQKIVFENYLEVRRHQGTVNKEELREILWNKFIYHTNFDLNTLKSLDFS